MIKYLIGLALLIPVTASAGRDCRAPWGGIVRDGASVMAYEKERPTNGERCRYEYRRCRDGYLSGWYRYRTCREDYSCNSADFGRLFHMESVIAYRSPDAYAPEKCESEVRRCQYGRLSGTFRHRYCTEHPLPST